MENEQQPSDYNGGQSNFQYMFGVATMTFSVTLKPLIKTIRFLCILNLF